MGASCQFARILGKVSTVGFDGLVYRLILAVELGVFCLSLSNLVMPLVEAGHSVQRAIFKPGGYGLVIKFVMNAKL